jgi:phosphoribosyl 1,2-cyclic phosphodiesterase
VVEVKITFYGTRGSCPCAGDGYQVFGGNTSCVLVETGATTPFILDAGTGLRELGVEFERQLRARSESLHARVLLTHLHYDHLLGLPFFAPLEDPNALVEIFGPSQAAGPLGEVVDSAVTPPFFPVQIKEFRGEIRLLGIDAGDVEIDGAIIKARWIPHTGPTLGYRIEAQGVSLAYLPDHQAPVNRVDIDPSVLELCDGADVVIHDAQYLDDEFEARSDWGHSTINYAVHVATSAKAKRLVLFHHDPKHDDLQLEEIEVNAQKVAAETGDCSVVAAREAMCIELGGALA